MDQLPGELIDRISSYLSPDDLRNTLLLSHGFRFPAEKYSGAFVNFHLKPETAEKFIRTFSGHRLLYLRNVNFGISLPLPKDNNRRDEADQLSKNDKSFTQQINFLFKTIKTVEERAGNQNKPGKFRLAIGPPARPISRKQQVLSYHNYLSWRVHLLEPQSLPLLESVRSLEVGADYDGPSVMPVDYNTAEVKLDYRVMVDLVVKLPNLEYWGCRMGGGEWSPKTQEAESYLMQDWAGPRRDTREDFAKALLSARLPSSLRRIRLDFLHDLHYVLNIDHLTAQPDLVGSSANDLFSTSLNHLSQHLRRLHLRVVADETLFWPKENCTPSWPNLESFIVMFHMVSPSGHWNFIGPDGEGRNTAAFEVTGASYPPLETTSYDEKMDDQVVWEGSYRNKGTLNTRIRIVPNNTTLRPFLAAFAKAASDMKALQEAMLWCPLILDSCNGYGEEIETDWLPKNGANPDRLAWGVHYTAPDEIDCTDQGERRRTEVPQIYWKVGKWRPDPWLHELFQQIGRNPWGDCLKEHWEDERYGQGLIDREYFEYSAQEEVDNVGRIRPHY
jgi:hypothetical protein